MTLDLRPELVEVIDKLFIESDGRVRAEKDGVEVSLKGTRVVHSYERENNKPKILSQGIVDATDVYLNPNLPMLQYDYVLIVDTNTKKVDGQRRSIGCAILCSVQHFESRASMSINGVFFVECRDIENTGSEENYVWAHVATAISVDDRFAGKRVVLVVDSDYQRLREMSERKLPIYDDYFLPENVNLIYATADAGKEWWINRLICAADRLATDFDKLKKLLELRDDASREITDEQMPVRWHFVRNEPEAAAFFSKFFKSLER